jgi:hypothetical protein
VKVGKRKKQTFTLTNESTSGQAITFQNPLAMVTNFPIFSFPAGGTNCHQILPAKKHCKLKVQFTPTSRGTPENGTVTILDNAGNADQTIPLSGTGQ